MSTPKPFTRYIVYSPPYNPCSGGVRQLHYLASLLHVIGVPTAMTVPCFFNPCLPVAKRANPGDVAVYPEIQPGNPLEADRVVRYALGFLDNLWARAGGGTIPNRELLLLGMASMRGQPDYLIEAAQPWTRNILTHENVCMLPCVTDGEWLFPETKRIRHLVYRGHRTCREEPVLPGGTAFMPPVDSRDLFASRMRTLGLLRAVEDFYTMDHYTVMESEARACGCRVFKVFGAHDWREQEPPVTGFVMQPKEDQVRAHSFHSKVCKFFGL